MHLHFASFAALGNFAKSSNIVFNVYRMVCWMIGLAFLFLFLLFNFSRMHTIHNATINLWKNREAGVVTRKVSFCVCYFFCSGKVINMIDFNVMTI